jgi:hypothetical protein
LFLGINDVEEDALASTQNANRRLISLLNSLVYPEADNDTSKEHIVAVKIVDGTIITHEKLGDSKTKTNSGRENVLKELRCDIVCECTVERPKCPGQEMKSQNYILYFDIEMQRKNVDRSIQRFLEYLNRLKLKYSDEVRVIGFLDYPTTEVVEKTRMGRLVRDSKTGKMVAAPEERDTGLQPMIGLKKVTESILKDEDVKIMENKIIGPKGKEWLKLLGIRWWAKNVECEYYVVPSQVQSQEVKDALEVLRKEKVDQDLFQKEVANIFDAQKILDDLENNKKQEGREEGREEGRVEGEAIGILKGEAIGVLKGEAIGVLKSLLNGFIDFHAISPTMTKHIKDSGKLLPRDSVEAIGNNYIDEEKITREKLDSFINQLESNGILTQN